MAGKAKKQVAVFFTIPQAEALLHLALNSTTDYETMAALFQNGQQRNAAYNAVAKLTEAALVAERRTKESTDGR